MERAAYGLLFFCLCRRISGVKFYTELCYTQLTASKLFVHSALLLQLLAPVNAGAGSIRGDARQRGFKTPRHCIWLSNFDRHVVWVLLRAPLRFKTASKVEITRKTLSY